jgi:DNA-directed RNA polymerase subunit K/omega
MSRPESAYLFVEVAAQRCLQLMRGARPKIDSSARKYSTLAVEEVEDGHVPWELRGPGDLVPVTIDGAADEEE